MTPSRLLRTLSFNLILIIGLTIAILPVHAAKLPASDPGLTSFVTLARNEQARELREVYVNGLFSLRVVQQPSGDPGYVSPLQDVVTEFQLAKETGNIGLLAHNYLAGKDFSALMKGQEVLIVFGDGKTEHYRVTQILRYQTLEPQSTTSDFLDLESGEHLSSTQLFAKVYRGPRHLTFQTCIAQDEEQSWGRLFIIAEPAIP